MRWFYYFFCILLGFSQACGQSFTPYSRTVFYPLVNRNIPILLQKYGENDSIVMLNLHDDETSSVNAARKVLRSEGGLLIRIMNKGERLIHFTLNNQPYRFDPNRIFSSEGINKSLDKFGSTSPEAMEKIGKFADHILSLIPEYATTVIALHNNTDGGYSVKSYMKGNDLGSDALDVFYNPLLDPDDFCFTTDSIVFRKMSEYGFNCILQDNNNASKDGSLSVYYGELGKRYINIETQEGKEKEYREMLEKLIEVLKKPH